GPRDYPRGCPPGSRDYPHRCPLGPREGPMMGRAEAVQYRSEKRFCLLGHRLLGLTVLDGAVAMRLVSGRVLRRRPWRGGLARRSLDPRWFGWSRIDSLRLAHRDIGRPGRSGGRQSDRLRRAELDDRRSAPTAKQPREQAPARLELGHQLARLP